MKTVTDLTPRIRPTEMSAAKINISNLRLRTYIGFNPEEKTKQQDVIINAEIHYRADPAFISDSEVDALDYKNITKRMIRHVEQGRFQLLEKLTADLLAIAKDSDRVSFAEIRVAKPPSQPPSADIKTSRPNGTCISRGLKRPMAYLELQPASLLEYNQQQHA